MGAEQSAPAEVPTDAPDRSLDRRGFLALLGAGAVTTGAIGRVRAAETSGDRTISGGAPAEASATGAAAGGTSTSAGWSGNGDGDGDALIGTGPRVGIEEVASGFASPVGFETAPEEADRRFIVDQVGTIHVHGPNGLEPDPFLDIRDRLVELRRGFDERGLLGLAFHPDFATNGRFYVRYSAPSREGTPEEYDHTFVLAEFTATEDLSRGDPSSERTLLEIPEPQFNHNAGAIAFGPDGFLYVGVGDGGGANDTGTGHVTDWYDANAGGNGQDVTENLLGSVLRIDVDGGDGDRPYGIPDDNPLVGTDGLDEHYAWGFRNPWRLSFDDRGRLFVADAGQELYEEVDLVEKGGNYGWNVREGAHCFSTDAPSDPPSSCPTSTPDSVRGGEPLVDPIIEYPHTIDGSAVGTVVIGGHVYESSTIPALDGKYVFGDWSRSFTSPDGRLFAASPPSAGGMWSIEALRIADTGTEELGRYVLGFGADDSGELYVLTSESAAPSGSSGGVFKLVPPGPVETIDLGGRVGGWAGREPVAIDGETNPTLELVIGLSYEVTWENLDGVTHDFQILDDAGNVVVETSDRGQRGATASATFTADQTMARYRCSFHPATMRGDLAVRSDPKTVGEAVAGHDRRVTLDEFRTAIRRWASGDVVPETGGRTVDLDSLRRIIAAWATGGRIS